MCLEFHMPRKVDGCHIHIPKHGALSAVDTRVTNFPAGGVFESARGHQRFAEPGTATVPGSSGPKAGFGPWTPASPIYRHR